MAKPARIRSVTRLVFKLGRRRPIARVNTIQIPCPAPSLFRRLHDKNRTWRVYFHDTPQSLLLRDIWLYAISHYRLFRQFLADSHAGSFPNYRFIEARYFTDLSSASFRMASPPTMLYMASSWSPPFTML